VESVVRRFNLEIGRRSSSSAKKWVNVVQHHSVDECYTMLRKEGKTIMATAFTKKAKDLYQLDLASNCALVFGNEKYGLTEEAIQKAEITFTIPQHGMIKSLNISVACAICLYESVRQRDKAGLYNTPQLNTTEIDYLRNNWLKLE
ncbi:MAG: RNA methyltransferase, partial [Bacteroidetes bacterium]|nr:RNA methyltransferase [Bacteroidota bacterium]